MKRKRTSEDLQACDLVLTDANGRSVRAHRALLMDKSEYFARVLNDHNLTELQLNENYLIELIHYLYNHDTDYGQPPVDASQLAISTDALYGIDNTVGIAEEEEEPLAPLPELAPACDGSPEDTEMGGQELGTTAISSPMEHSPLMTHGDIEILMRMLVLSNKYGFRQLYKNLMNEINYKLGPLTAITVYKNARELDIREFLDQTRMMILSWLSQLQVTDEFLTLNEDAIRDIFAAESPDIESENKLDALSAWWSHNKQSDMTDLWVKIMMST